MPTIPVVDEEQLRIQLLRAVRAYNIYRDRDTADDYFDFPTYAHVFHGISKKHAERFWLNQGVI